MATVFSMTPAPAGLPLNNLVVGSTPRAMVSDVSVHPPTSAANAGRVVIIVNPLRVQTLSLIGCLMNGGVSIDDGPNVARVTAIATTTRPDSPGIWDWGVGIPGPNYGTNLT